MVDLMERLRGGLVVSCQAYDEEPMNDADTMTKVAAAVVAGGAVAVRAQGLDHLRQMRGSLAVPLIGLWKDILGEDGKDGVFITPTLDHALAVAEAGADIVALDATVRPRPDGRTFAQTVSQFRERSDALLMADVSNAEEGRIAADCGVDLVGTTLSGYTPYTPKLDGPDLDLVEELAGTLRVPVIAEGRIHTQAQAAQALRLGAFAVVVGTAITHPTSITRWFVDALA